MINKIKLHLNNAGHMIFTTFPIIQEHRMLISIFREIHQAVHKIVVMLLKIEREKMQIKVYKDPKLNFKTFIDKVALRYLTKEQLGILIQILKINKKHKISSLEFVRQDKFVIFTDDSYEILTIEVVKEFYNVVKEIILRIEEKIK